MARSFNGSSDYIQTALTPATLAVTQFSISAWIYETSPVTRPRIAENDHTDASSNGFQFYVQQSVSIPGLSVDVGNGSLHTAVNTNGGSILATNTWFHTAFTLNSGASRLLVYLNGVAGSNGGWSGGTPTAGVENLVIGAGHSFGGNFFQGNIADVAVWTTELSASQVLALSKGARPFQVDTANLKGWWPLDGLQSPEPDLSGNAHNGTLTGTALAPGPPITMFTPRWNKSILPTSTSGSTVNFRRALSPLGTRSGSRQAQVS